MLPSTIKSAFRASAVQVVEIATTLLEIRGNTPNQLIPMTPTVDLDIPTYLRKRVAIRGLCQRNSK